MVAYIVYLQQIPELLRKWSSSHDVYVPTRVEDHFYEFRPWQEKMHIAWDYDLAYSPLKVFFMPPREDLIHFDLHNYTASPVIKKTRQLLFGVHPYDIKAINQLDQLMGMDGIDVNYQNLRDNTVIFGLEPARLAETAFWAGVDAARVDFGFDLFWTRISPGAFLVRVGSAQGEEMLKMGSSMTSATAAEKEAARRIHLRTAARADKQSFGFTWTQVPEFMNKFYSRKLYWREKAKTCLSCGSCNLVCPTCYCFDIQDETDDHLKTGKRYRQWDGCMLEGFARIAGGLNFRPNAWERYRHRYMRKGKYIYDRIGELGCVGCGRCVKACTAKIANPREVFREIREAIKNEV